MGVNINLDTAVIQGLDLSTVDGNVFQGQVGTSTNNGIVFKGADPSAWKYPTGVNGGANLILAANPGGDAGFGANAAAGYYVYDPTSTDLGGSDPAANNDGNTEIFTALDDDGSDFGARGGTLGAWFDYLRNNNILTGLGVAGLTPTGGEGSATNQGVTTNTEIQSSAGIGSADKLLVDFNGVSTTTASFQSALFYGNERVNWAFVGFDANNQPIYDLTKGGNDSEGLTYQLLKSDPSGSITIGGKKYTSVTPETSVYSSNGKSFLSGTGNFSGTPGNLAGEPGLNNTTVTSTNAFDAVLFGGQDYKNKTPGATTTFKPNDVSDSLLNNVAILDEGLLGGSGDDTIGGGDGNDTLAGGPGTYDCYGGNDPASWAAKGATLSANILGGAAITYTAATTDVFTALDENTNDYPASFTAINQLEANEGLSGIGVGDPNGGYNNQELPGNPEIQGDSNSNAQITEGDKLTIDFNKEVNTARVTVNLFYSAESIAEGDPLASIGPRPEQLKYALYDGSTLVQGPTLVTAKDTGTFSSTNAGEFVFVVNSEQKWDTIKLIGENYGKNSNGDDYPSSVVNPTDISDFLLKGICLNSDGSDDLVGGAGDDTFELKGIGGVDTIVDFGTGSDTISINKADFAADYGVAASSIDVTKFTYAGGVLKFDLDGAEVAPGWNGGRPSVDIAKIQGPGAGSFTTSNLVFV